MNRIIKKARFAMTKRQAEKYFNENIKPCIWRTYTKKDKAAMREAWNDWTDSLCKDGKITQKQYYNWTYPKSCR